MSMNIICVFGDNRKVYNILKQLAEPMAVESVSVELYRGHKGIAATYIPLELLALNGDWDNQTMANELRIFEDELGSMDIICGNIRKVKEGKNGYPDTLCGMMNIAQYSEDSIFVWVSDTETWNWENRERGTKVFKVCRNRAEYLFAKLKEMFHGVKPMLWIGEEEEPQCECVEVTEEANYLTPEEYDEIKEIALWHIQLQAEGVARGMKALTEGSILSDV